MKLLIVGCAGQVGKELVQRAPRNWEVKALDRQDLDITNFAKVTSIIDEFIPDAVINAAAYTAVDRAESETELAHQINCLGAKNLAIATNALGAMLLHISTDYVFTGDVLDKAYLEEDVTGPTGVYGESKLAGEIAIAAVCPKHIILRTAWVFGEYGNNFVKTMLRLAQTRNELSVVADQFGSPTYAGDIADTLLSIAAQLSSSTQDDRWGIYHYSGQPYVSWADFAIKIFEEAHSQALLSTIPLIKPIPTSAYPTAAKRPTNSRLDCSKIAKAFEIEPSDWQLALSNIVKFSK